MIKRRNIDLNADVGEGTPWDELLFASGISSANIACGAHAGGVAEMDNACRLAARHDVAVGAHPGHRDRDGFGRRVIPITPADVPQLVRPQIHALASIAKSHALPMRHVKAHGALYHQIGASPDLAASFVAAVAAEAPGVLIYGLPGSALEEACEGHLTFVAEGFADRGYDSSGLLIPRTIPGALLSNTDVVAAQALQLVASGRIDTLCIHGDGEHAHRLMLMAASALRDAGYEIKPPGSSSP